MSKKTVNTASRPVDHLMDDQEWESFQLSLGHAPVVTPVKTKTERKKTQHQLNEMLLYAAREGSVKTMEEALEAGANVNNRMRSGSKETALTLALREGHDEAALFLLKKGGWRAPDSYGNWHSSESEAFNKAVKDNHFGDDLITDLKQKTFELFLSEARHWDTLVTAAHACDAFETSEKLLLAACKNQAAASRLDRIKQAMDAGVQFNGKMWDALSNGVKSGYYHGLMSHPNRDQVLKLIENPEAVKSITSESVNHFYESAIRTDDRILVKKLLAARLKPSANWQLEMRLRFGWYEFQELGFGKNPDDSEKIKMASPIWMALGLQNQELFNDLMQCPPMVAAAKANPESPWVLEPVAINTLMEMMDKGFSLSGIDKDGNGLAHIWARVDKTPRAGWATLARKAPEIFNLRNNAGETAPEVMAKKLEGDDKEAFLASLSRVESREIRREIPAASVAKDKKAKERSRL